ncbi:lytic transglycosylase domain-containing protein [Thiobacillus denitrificans]|uniref:SLT domain-containing protein n=1 Tax=Thiobacillus denitrificans TaxID=36861 RepID=A0A106BRK7_THIDE|nr:lytic transglycosylase domain-containing protein [Thiobacillus denitrificans]KVW97332.1 SLT domain-containing protein [Thiobacillus denitrificans]
MSRIIGFFLLVMLPVTPVLAASGDAAILQAQQAFAARKLANLERAARAVPDDHVLSPYVDYWRLMLTSHTGDARVADFLARYPGSRMAEALRADWLKSLGVREAWPVYLAEYPRLVNPEAMHQCYAYRAEWALGDRSHQREAVAMWFTGRDMPSACTPLFEQMIEAGLVGQEDIWRRLRLALEANNPNVAQAVANALPAAQRPTAILLEQASRDPARLLSAGSLDPGQRSHREIALYALDQLARRNSNGAMQALRKWAPQFAGEELQAAWARLATWAARRHEAAALPWFQQAGVAATNDFQREWWVRAALRAGDWQAVQRTIESMSDPTRAQPVWRYWRARALQANGQRAASNPLFLALGREHHYYGQLAQDELGAVMQAPVVNIKTGGDDIAAIARQPGIARALALYELGLRGDANQEWNWTIQTFADAQLLAAAELARRMEWYDRAINTAERTRELHDFELRFLAPYRELAQKAARENELDEAWVFGLMRQESRFINVARSGVGASGLMQIMPATARWIAQRLGIKGFNPREMQDPAKNIQFGAYYLKHVQTSLDGSPVLATAAYNAGPGRAQRWRDTRPMEAAVYIESIPFAETRDYVKKVMSNAMYYAARFGHPSVLLTDRLGTVPPRRTPVIPTPDSDASPELD